jgi:hypothetical protein
MIKSNKIMLLIAIIGLITGTLLKLNSYKNFGDIFLGLSTLVWFYFIYTLIFKNRKKVIL